jgi:hypothetical protein
MKRTISGTVFRLALLVAGAIALGACGGGGGGGGGGNAPPPASQRTTFVGNLLAPSETAIAGSSAVQVCVLGTSFCTEVDETGAFTLAADIGGDVVLVFDGPGFTARLPVNDVPAGATVRIENIECSTLTGQCHAENVEIVGANAPPNCSAPMASPAVLWPPNHDMVRIAIVGVVDPDGDPISITATDVVANEPEDAPGSGNTAPDFLLSPLAVRAERSGQGDGRVYTIEFVADDGRGGSCTGVVTVCVPHDQGQGNASG